jgi:poly(beta-D-mannuronate) lyase
VQVTDAVVMNNTFVDCTPASLCEGSDAERTLPPQNVLFAKNVFYSSTNTVVYYAWNDIQGIHFADNIINTKYNQHLNAGFEKTALKTVSLNNLIFPIVHKETDSSIIDSLLNLNKDRLPSIATMPGYGTLILLKQLLSNAYYSCGAKWFSLNEHVAQPISVNCKTAAEVYEQLKNQVAPLIIHLTGNNYLFNQPLIINQKIEFTSPAKSSISISSTAPLSSLFIIKNKSNLSLQNIRANVNGLQSNAFIASDTAGSAEHYTLSIKNISIENLTACTAIFQANKSTIADSIVIEDCNFYNLKSGFLMNSEKDNKGYYNAEKIFIANNHFEKGNGVLLTVYRGGNDESTLGPTLSFTNNIISNYNTQGVESVISLTGVQKSKITYNAFSNCNESGRLIIYKDTVRARHLIDANKFIHSGIVEKNDFVTNNMNEFR